MNYYYPVRNNQATPAPTQPLVVYPVDPYVYETLQTVRGAYVVLETTRGSVDGTIADVKPDHVVLEKRGGKFFVRIAEIVWIMPG